MAEVFGDQVDPAEVLAERDQKVLAGHHVHDEKADYE